MLDSGEKITIISLASVDSCIVAGGLTPGKGIHADSHAGSAD